MKYKIRYSLGSSPFDYFVKQKRILAILGFFDLDTDSTLLKRVHAIALNITKWLFFYLGLILQTLSLFVSDSLEVTANILFLDSAYWNIAIKTTIVFAKNHKIRALWKELETDLDFRTISDVESKHVRRAHLRIMLLNFVASMSIAGGVIMVMIPYMLPGRNLPLSFWTPFDPTKTQLTFRLMYAFEVICTWVCTAYNISTDVFVFVVLIAFNFAIALLCERIESLGNRNVAERRRAVQGFVKVAVYGELIELIKIHYKFDRLFKVMSSIFNEWLFIQVIQSVVVFANCGILILTMGVTIATLFQLVVFFGTYLLHTGLYCYLPDSITTTYEQLAGSAYASNFLAFDVKTKKALILLMNVTSNRSLKIQPAVSIRFELSLETFLKILRSTYSIITVLRSV